MKYVACVLNTPNICFYIVILCTPICIWLFKGKLCNNLDQLEFCGDCHSMTEPECIYLDCICGTDSTVTGGCGCTDYQWNYPLRIYKGLKLAICQPRDLRGLNGEVRVLVFIEHSSFSYRTFIPGTLSGHRRLTASSSSRVQSNLRLGFWKPRKLSMHPFPPYSTPVEGRNEKTVLGRYFTPRLP